MSMRRLTFLGTGTSTGVPVNGCDCEVCKSTDPHDKRYRAAALLETNHTRILIDCGPDIRMQLMPLPFRRIDGLLLTHGHYDHVGGLDDLRPFCKFGDIDIYGNDIAVKTVMHNFPYCFVQHLYPGVPKFNLHTIRCHQRLVIGDVEVEPFGVMHDKLPILGYRFGDFAYITDMKTIEDEEFERLRGVKTLVVNALRWEKWHHSHMTVEEAVAFAQRVGAERTYFTHMGHGIGLHDEANARLPKNMWFAYDGEIIEV